MNDLISRQAAIDTINSYFGFNIEEEYGSAVQEVINGLPSAQPEYYDYSDIEPLWKSFAEENDINLTETAKQLKDAMWCGYRKGKADAQLEPSQVARDIATIIENEKDMRVIARSEITDEQAILHLQASGWMQRHDKEMYESGLRTQFTDNNDSYDTLLKSAQSKSIRTFIELVVEYPDPELCTYKEYKGKPYYSIKYTENGETYVGYGTYNPKVLSQYLKEYFIPSAQLEEVTSHRNYKGKRITYCETYGQAID